MSMVCGMSETDGKFCLILRSSSYPFLRSSNLIRSEMRSTFGFAFFFFFARSILHDRVWLFVLPYARLALSYAIWISALIITHIHIYIVRWESVTRIWESGRSPHRFHFLTRLPIRAFSLSLSFMSKKKKCNLYRPRDVRGYRLIQIELKESIGFGRGPKREKIGGVDPIATGQARTRPFKDPWRWELIDGTHGWEGGGVESSMRWSD